jgi:hypothetical protein
MKEIEMAPPEDVIQLNLRFEGDGNNGTDSWDNRRFIT